MTANSAANLIKWHAVDPVLGLPPMNAPSDINLLQNETYLDRLGLKTEVKAQIGNHGGTAMLVLMPTGVLFGDVLVCNMDDYTTVRSDTASLGLVGVALHANGTGAQKVGWMLIEGKCLARVHTTIAANGTLGRLLANPGQFVASSDAGATLVPGAIARSARSTVAGTAGSGVSVGTLDVGYAEVQLSR
jgi:hypothetical protein